MKVKALLLALLPLAVVAAEIDPMTTRWTFGAHEPYTMYRRMGVRSTGGIHGNCYWLPEW